MIRFFDLLFSFLGLLVFLPFLPVISLFILLDSGGSIFYRQTRVGRNGKDFRLFKFRTMVPGADRKGFLTVGMRDGRITKVGYFLRNTKIDELPQLINVLKGDMSMVGPRPEIRKYVELYSREQWKVLTVRPGLTDYASVEFINENEILGRSSDPEETYIREVMPAKIVLNMRFIQQPTLRNYFVILGKTLQKILT